MSGVVIVNQRLENNGWLKYIDLKNKRISSSIAADLIFADCVPSVAIIFCDHTSTNTETALVDIEKVQNQFKHAFLISIGLNDDQKWMNFQMEISGKSLRLLRVNDIPSAMSLAMECYETMKPNEKFQMQTKYFELEKQRIVSSEMSRFITYTQFDKLDISFEDTQLIIEGFPTIAQIISATREIFAENSPVDGEVLNKIATFFEFDTFVQIQNENEVQDIECTDMHTDLSQNNW